MGSPDKIDAITCCCTVMPFDTGHSTLSMKAVTPFRSPSLPRLPDHIPNVSCTELIVSGTLDSVDVEIQLFIPPPLDVCAFLASKFYSRLATSKDDEWLYVDLFLFEPGRRFMLDQIARRTGACAPFREKL